LVADQLTTTWDATVGNLSTGYARTRIFLEAGDATNAVREFRTVCRVAVKKLYTEAATTYPPRYAKAGDWCAWMKELYVLAADIEKTLLAWEGGDAEAAKKAGEQLKALRVHFRTLREKTGQLAVNDYIFTFREEANRENPDLAALKTAKAAIDAAALCYHARTPPNPFKDAKDIWSTSINLILADDQLTPDELQPLRAATKAFYDAYGCHLE